jgi:outer membrane protein OmpA-like peptidoglycan-associated protein
MASSVARALVVAVLAGACAAPAPPPPPPPPVAAPPRQDLFVVLPGADGQTGAVSVTAGGRTEVLDQPYAAVRVPEPGRLERGTVTSGEVRAEFGDALDARPPRPVSFTLYFVEGQDRLTPESVQELQALLAEVGRRPAPEIVIVGHTDRRGSDAYNDALSRQRAERVRAELLGLGVDPGRVQVAGRGEREPLVPTEDEVPEPRNRRVEVTVR